METSNAKECSSYSQHSFAHFSVDASKYSIGSRKVIAASIHILIDQMSLKITQEEVLNYRNLN